MYTVDDRDRVVELHDLPESCAGAPCPMVIAAELHLLVAYLMPITRASADYPSEEPLAVVRFVSPRAHMFGPPNDEAFGGHPLAKRGLQPYRAFEIHDSSWIRGLETMNRVHVRHDAMSFALYRHFVLAFHDSTFECVAKGYESDRATGPLRELLTGASRAVGE